MKEQLQAALQSIASGSAEAAEPAAKRIKQLERGAEGLFQTASVDDNLFEAARLVYPVYAAYETECNKKEGYPDLLAQMQALKGELEKADTLQNTAAFLDALLGTLENVSPQLYEYYRELADLFKETVKEALKKYYRDGRFTENPNEGVENREAEKLLRAAIARAAELHILLGEKYQVQEA